jgi:hypothetical protein
MFDKIRFEKFPEVRGGDMSALVQNDGVFYVMDWSNGTQVAGYGEHITAVEDSLGV